MSVNERINGKKGERLSQVRRPPELQNEMAFRMDKKTDSGLKGMIRTRNPELYIVSCVKKRRFNNQVIALTLKSGAMKLPAVTITGFNTGVLVRAEDLVKSYPGCYTECK